MTNKSEIYVTKSRKGNCFGKISLVSLGVSLGVLHLTNYIKLYKKYFNKPWFFFMHWNGIRVSSLASAGNEGSVGEGLSSCLSPCKSWPRSQTAALLPGSTFLAGWQGQNNLAAHATPSLGTCCHACRTLKDSPRAIQMSYCSTSWPSNAQMGRTGEKKPPLQALYQQAGWSRVMGCVLLIVFGDVLYFRDPTEEKQVNKMEVLLVNECTRADPLLSQHSLYFRVQGCTWLSFLCL